MLYPLDHCMNIFHGLDANVPYNEKSKSPKFSVPGGDPSCNAQNSDRKSCILLQINYYQPSLYSGYISRNVILIFCSFFYDVTWRASNNIGFRKYFYPVFFFCFLHQNACLESCSEIWAGRFLGGNSGTPCSFKNATFWLLLSWWSLSTPTQISCCFLGC